MSAPLVADIEDITWVLLVVDIEDMSAPLVADIEDITWVLLLLQIKRILHECSSCCRFRGSYMSAHILLILLIELGKRAKMKDLPSILSLLHNEFNKINNSRAWMLDYIYHMTLRIFWDLIFGVNQKEKSIQKFDPDQAWSKQASQVTMHCVLERDIICLVLVQLRKSPDMTEKIVDWA